MRTLPAGTATFLFTDIEGSTKLWELVPDKMQIALQHHHAILQRAIESNDGVVFQIVGDAFCAAFDVASHAVHAAVEAQQRLFDTSWDLPFPIRVRMGIHTGLAELHQDDTATGGYASNQTLNRVARIMSAGHGGQILLSLATEELSRDALPINSSLESLGPRRLRDVLHPEHLFQLNVSGLPCNFPPLKTQDSFPNNLPTQLTSFVGREKEITEVRQELAGHRLVTLTGPGGTGKTRLSLQIAAQLLEKFDHGVWFVELAPLTNPELIPQTILAALNINQPSGKSSIDIVQEYLHERQTLIVLDNCEHLIDASASVASMLLNAAPKLRILATSRERLGIQGEHVYPVPSLALPNVGDAPTNDEQLLHCEAVQLFLDRAASVQPKFKLTSKNAAAVAQICHHLDGIPLALELAAARVRSLTAEQIALRLADRFRLLTGGSRTAPLRQQTLRTLIDWSYDLLSESERILLSRISVFTGGFTLDAVENVASGGLLETDQILDVLTHLVEKSLIVAEERNEEMRYRLLETIQQYANEKLLTSGEWKETKDGHLEYFIGLAEHAEAQSHGSEQKSWWDRLDTELDNLRSALNWVLESQNVESGMRLLGPMPRFWQLRSYLVEGHDWSIKLLDLEMNNVSPEATESYLAIKAHAFLEVAFLWGACWLRRIPTDLNRINVLLHESQRIYRQLGDSRGQATALAMIATNALYENRTDDAKISAEESLRLSEVVGDKWLMAEVLNNVLGFGAALEGNYQKAKAYMTQGLTLRKELRDKDGTAYTLLLLGTVTLYEGDHAKAAEILKEALVLFREAENAFMIGIALSRLGAASFDQGQEQLGCQLLIEGLELSQATKDRNISTLCLNEFAGLLGKLNQWDRSTRILGVVSAQFAGIVGAMPFWIGPGRHERYVAAARANMDEDAFHAAWSAGQAMTLEDAIVYALKG